MKFGSSFLLAVAVLCLPAFVQADDDAKKPLLGVWTAKSMKANGADVPAEVVKKMRFTFSKDALLIRGNYGDDREQKCKYKIDASQSPKHFEFTPPELKNPIQGIYQLKDGSLKICVVRGGNGGKRPTEFNSTPDSGLILFVLQKADPKKP